MFLRNLVKAVIGIGLVVLLTACASPNPQPVGLTPIPSLAPEATLTLVPALQGMPAQGVALVSEVQDSAALGAPIFLTNCSPCHGNQGQGVDAPPVRNSQYIQTTDDQELFNTISNGRPGTEMPAWLLQNGGSLTQAQISSVVAYLHTLQKVSPLPSPAPEEEQEPTSTPLPQGAPTPEPARPSNSGEAGQAVSLQGDPVQGQESFGLYCAACHGPEGVQGIPNPGSDDEAVPELNPVDPTIVNPDAKQFAENIDLFIEHGSVPEGDGPRLVMPSFGDSQMLTPQQIADLIAYVISLNNGGGTR